MERFGDDAALGGAPLLAAAQSSTAVSRLFAEHYLALVRLARHLVDDQDTAEDVVQDVFAGLTGSRAESLEAPERYLRSAVVNRCRSALRRRRLARVFVTSRSRPPGNDDAADGADVQVLLAERRQQVLDAVSHLPARQREVVVLTYYLDLDIAEVADLLAISPSAVSSSLGRAMVSLTRTLGDLDA